jgi:hypothetical protein
MERQSLFGAVESMLVPYGAVLLPLQSQKSPGFEAFHRRSSLCHTGSTRPPYLLARIALHGLGLRRKPWSPLNFLFCMFSGFAFARPFCGRIKEIPNGG